MTTETNDQDIDIIERRIEKLLRLAEGRENEPEAIAAMQKAQKLADDWNIEIAGIQGSKPGKRQDDLFPGGLYSYQRMLYEAIAKLNHCLYWSKKGLQRGEKYKHRIVGSKVNVLLTRQMAEYLQSTVERITRQEYCGGDPKCYFTKESHYFREGMIERIVEKIHAKRREEEEERKRKNAEEAARASHPSYAGTGTSLMTVDDVAQREAAANYDFQYGEGAWARKMAREAEYEVQRKAAAEAARIRAEELERWKMENPEEWEAQERARKARADKEFEDYLKKERRNASRRRGVSYYRPSKEDRKYSSGAYHSGRERGSSVGLDRQVDGGSKGSLK